MKFVLDVHKLTRGELVTVAINTAGYLRRPISNTRRTTFSIVDVVAASTTAVRHVIVTAAVVAAAVSSTPAAHADSVGDAMAPVLNGVGIGNNGPVSGAIAQVGQSICPMLVKPGSSFASSAAQVSGHGGLAPPLAGFLAGMAIQSQCPSFMASVANGNMPFPIPGGAPAGLPFGPVGAPSPSPLQLPGL
ncbi:MAG: DUF732 domain-containing protein [Mycobacterium sp.]|uniref:hypothetical protein n=1 Tax=Mycobacterium sp. TaxID=1785 RepID=UPI003BB768D7